MFILALFLLFIPASIGVFIYFNAPVRQEIRIFSEELDGIRRGENNDCYFDVRRGETAQSVGRRLERAGLISNKYLWYLLCRFGNDFLKTGTYRLEIPASQLSIYRILVSGRQIMYRVTIPEGVTLKKAAKILEDNGICPAREFLEAAKDPQLLNRFRVPNDTMEGYLFPDTYLFPREYPAASVLRSMADTFFKKIEEIEPSVHGMSAQELNKKVIIASIVEREYRVAEEAPVMAGVFYNRLEIGMALQSCATVEYIITEIQEKPHPKVLYNIDLEIRSPYNTYILPGLPPGPISAPGAVALAAAFHPVQSNYLFFRLNDPSAGKHYFSRTLDEHIRAGQLLTKSSF